MLKNSKQAILISKFDEFRLQEIFCVDSGTKSIRYNSNILYKM